MRSFLLFQLCAPLASFGEVAGYTQRTSATRPTRSQLLGLVAAAMGLRRDDPRQSALSEGYGVACAMIKPGSAVFDYHTVQSIPSARGLYATRRDGLQMVEDLATSLTHREYYQDVAGDVALWLRDDAPFRLEEILERLKKPLFTLYWGRKACTLSLPLNPAIIEAAWADDALHEWQAREPDPLRKAVFGDVQSQSFAGDGDGLRQSNRSQRTRRWDQPVDRVAWHFTSRDEILIETGMGD